MQGFPPHQEELRVPAGSNSPPLTRTYWLPMWRSPLVGVPRGCFMFSMCAKEDSELCVVKEHQKKRFIFALKS